MVPQKMVVVSFFVLMLVYLMPMGTSLGLDNTIEPIINNYENFRDALLRSTILSVSTALITVVLSFIISVSLFKLPFFSAAGKNLSFLLLPVLLGNITVAYVFRTWLSNTTFLNYLLENKFLLSVFWCLLEFWKMGFLFIYLFFLSFQSIPASTIEYAKANNLSFSVQLRDIVLPASQNLIIFLLILGFIFTFYESCNAQLVFFFSRGKETELISGWFHRIFQQKTSIQSASKAAALLYINGIIVAITAIVLLSVITFFTNNIVRRLSVRRSENFCSGIQFGRKGILIACILILLSVIPAIVPFFNTTYEFAGSFQFLLTSIWYTLLAAVFATVISIIFGAFARLAWPLTLCDLNNRSISFFILTLGILLVPPICVYVVSFFWLGLIGYSDPVLLLCTWILIHGILSLPLLGSFLLSIHFRVKNKELFYLQAYSVNNRLIIKWSFLKRFRIEYLLAFIVCYSLIWNDYSINAVLSDRITSFASVLTMAFSGRGANEAIGLQYFAISLGLALTSIMIWRIILNKAEKKIRGHE